MRTRLLRRFLLLFIVLASLAWLCSLPLARLLLPVFHSEIAWADDTYSIDSLGIDTDGADHVFRLRVHQVLPIVLGGRIYLPDPRGIAESTTLVGNLGVPAVLMTTLGFAAPTRGRRTYLLRGLMLLPALVTLWVLDVPLILWASIWNLHVQAFEPGRWSPLLIWSHLMQDGGRIALAVALGLLIGSLDLPPAAVEGDRNRA